MTQFTEIYPKSPQPNLMSNMELLLELAPVAILTANQVGQIIFVNAKIEEMFGYQRSELLGQTIEKLLPHNFHQIHKQHRLHQTASSEAHG